MLPKLQKKMSKLISIGKILNFHGIKGEVKMGFTAGNENLIKSLKQVFVFQNNVKIPLDIVSIRFHKNFAIVKFKQINSINEVMPIKGLLVHIEENIFKSKLQNDEFLINDLIGADVFDTENQKIGTVVDMGENKASDLLQIQKTNGLCFMVPFVKEWVPGVDLENNKIVIKMENGIDTTVNQEQNENDKI